jgi:hypothetical protein
MMLAIYFPLPTTKSSRPKAESRRSKPLRNSGPILSLWISNCRAWTVTRRRGESRPIRRCGRSRSSRSPPMRLVVKNKRRRRLAVMNIREGDDFDYRRWIQRVRREEAQAKHFPVLFSAGEFVGPEIGDLPNTPDRPDGWSNAEPALPARSARIPSAVDRSDHKASRERSEDRLRQRLVTVCNAFDEFQESRVRDAVYGYLKAVFALVVDCKGRRQTKRLLQRAFKFAGLPFDKKADPFVTVIRCTSERNVDNKTISKWARALRYVAHCKVPQKRLRTFMKKRAE